MNILTKHINCDEETICQIWNRCKKYNDMLKITWKNFQRGLDMDFFLDKNNIPNETEDDFTIFIMVKILKNEKFIPIIYLYFNDN